MFKLRLSFERIIYKENKGLKLFCYIIIESIGGGVLSV